ncbi:hypothetical protein AVEN_185857-1 [Araneus ventricosus]|uniref:Uncharacterized protein n=1 Tax=Araneus ventricosus TaxID=182803 RepID=A0A4Y2JIG2_ARAVE|nr:hypothetical protein AVEN_185857-1 [Araneus ventricosus]
MISLDDVWLPIACHWLSPYHYRLGIVVDFKSRLIRNEYVAPLLWCSTAMFTGPIQQLFDVRWRQRHTNNRSRASNPPSCSVSDKVWRDMGLPVATESCAASCCSVSVLWRLAQCNRFSLKSFTSSRGDHRAAELKAGLNDLSFLYDLKNRPKSEVIDFCMKMDLIAKEYVCPVCDKKWS